MSPPATSPRSRIMVAPNTASSDANPFEIDGNQRSVERNVQRALASRTDLRFSNLVVRRAGAGLCLTGVVETSDGATDISALVRQASGVDAVMNRLLVCPKRTI